MPILLKLSALQPDPVCFIPFTTLEVESLHFARTTVILYTQARRGVRKAVQVSLEGCPALVLNADFRPLSYHPLSVWPWQDAIKASYLGRVSIVAVYDRVVHSPSIQLNLPSVIALKSYVTPARQPAFTRFNVFLRDCFVCQYCGDRFPTEQLTFDHLIPRSRGGRTNWDNIVTACTDCNTLKGSNFGREFSMRPLRQPSPPTTWQLLENGRCFPPNHLHESWHDYLYWDTELDTG